MLTTRFDDAIVFASGLHRTQRRKGTNLPYMSHLLAVTALVLEHGGTEDQAIAALLHDAVARVAKSADATDLKSVFRQRECGFKSHPGHHGLKDASTIFNMPGWRNRQTQRT
jgi:hypothetical protein